MLVQGWAYYHRALITRENADSLLPREVWKDLEAKVLRGQQKARELSQVERNRPPPSERYGDLSLQDSPGVLKAAKRLDERFRGYPHPTATITPVSYTHLTLPTNREV